jgi:excisionase family DNA binding protein
MKMQKLVEDQRERLLTAREVAQLLGVCPRTILNLVVQGRMPSPIRMGPKLVRWREHEIVSWIHAGCPSTKEGAR